MAIIKNKDIDIESERTKYMFCLKKWQYETVKFSTASMHICSRFIALSIVQFLVSEL